MKVAASIATVFSKRNYEREFLDFIGNFEKRYEATEFATRFQVFKDNMNKIDEHNAKNLSWTMGVNQFSDMTPDEFKKNVIGNGLLTKARGDEAPVKTVLTAPDSVDWEAKGKVTPVKNQGQCGSCWAFSTTGSTEARSAIAANGSPNSLSEQELVDCAGKYGNKGCQGGLMDYGFQYVKAKGGLCSETGYPYKGRNERCEENCGKRSDSISSFKDVTPYSEEALQNAVADGPVSVAIEADQSSFQQYKGGVLTAKCGKNLDHGVLAVGYGTDGAHQYWKVKNSWGATWGMKGYVLIEKGKKLNCGLFDRKCEGQCGILVQPSYPVV